MFILFFFFKQKTAYEMRISDWSSDVCSSDLTFPLSSARTGRAFSIVLTDDVLRDLLRSHHGCKIGARRHDGWKDRCVGDPETFHANHSAAIVDDGIGVLRRTQPAGPDGKIGRAHV